MLGNAISSFLYGNTPSYQLTPKKQPSCPEVRIDIPEEPVATPPEPHRFSDSETHLIFDLLLEHSDAMLDALEVVEKPPTWWDQVMSCFSRGRKKQENGPLTYLLWASGERNTRADRNARIAAIQKQAEEAGKPVPSHEEVAKTIPYRPVWKFNPNLRNHKGEYLLMRAAQNGHYPNAIQKLIAAGAKLDILDQDGRSPLMHTVLNGDEAGAIALIEAGARLDTADRENQRNALGYALMQPTEQHRRIAEAILKQHEANRPDGDIDNTHDRALLEQRDKLGRTPLTYALENGFQDIAEELLGRSGDLNASDEAGCTPLMYAAMDDGEENLVPTLVGNGANLQSQDKKQRTALIHAANAGSTSSVHKLLSQGAAVDSQDNQGRTALMYAARQRDGVVAKKLIWELCNRGATLDLPDARGRTALMHAARAGTLDSLKFLDELEADLDLTDDYGNTALMLAVKHNKPLAVWTLCKLGADPNRKDADGKSPYQLAEEQKITPVLTAFYYMQDEETPDGEPIIIDGYNDAYTPPDTRLSREIARYALSH